MNTNRILAAMTMLLCSAGAASAGTINATITADNHYALYVDGPGGVQYVGGNELGAGGAPGTYNWSRAESWAFQTLQYIYIAAWSDKSVAQGLLAQITLPTGQTLHTGDKAWKVMYSGINKTSGSAHPVASEIQTLAALADANDLWEAPYIGEQNLPSTGPWGRIDGITSDARWTWGNPARVADPLRGGADHAEYQVFRVAIPTPGAAALAGVGMLMCVRRRRNA